MDYRLLIVALIAYLVGSIPFGYILVKMFLKQDIRATGSGNIGATNVARSGSKGLAVATLLLDAGKGAVAVLCVPFIYFELALRNFYLNVPAHTPYAYAQPLHNAPDRFPLMPLALAVMFAILGHMFPIWLRFKGGKGVATAAGAYALFAPLAAFGALIIFGLVFAVTRYVSLGSIFSALAFPVMVYVFSTELRALPVLALISFSSLLIILKHHGNIRRLIAGTEPRFGKQAIGTNDPGETEKSI